jgi:hypothetical protein
LEDLATREYKNTTALYGLANSMRNRRRQAILISKQRKIDMTANAAFAQTQTEPKQEVEYWVYVNPMTGRYALTKDKPPCLAVFVCEQGGRMAEKRSWVLCQLVGHLVLWNEVQQIAQKETEGRVCFFDSRGKRL